MNHEIQDLARRAVTCERWRWMPGMLAFPDLAKQGGRVCRVDHQIELALDEREIDEDGGEWHTQMRSSTNTLTVDGRDRWNHLPDLTDPATLGCLLALVREAWGDPNVTPYQCHRSDCLGVTHSDVGLYWEIALDGYLYYGPSETAGLVAALEAAP